MNRIAELENALRRMVKAHEDTESDSEGRYPQPDMGCIECTVGTVPNHRNTGPCAYHHAKKLLRGEAMNHKRRRHKAARAGCLMCKPNKRGAGMEKKLGHRGFGKLRAEKHAEEDMKDPIT